MMLLVEVEVDSFFVPDVLLCAGSSWFSQGTVCGTQKLRSPLKFAANLFHSFTFQSLCSASAAHNKGWLHVTVISKPIC